MAIPIMGPVGPMGPPGAPGLSVDALVEYTDILFSLMGVDITFDRFQSMSTGERLQFVRDLKINKIINE